MPLEDLQVALKVAEFRSITAAAASLEFRGQYTKSTEIHRLLCILSPELPARGCGRRVAILYSGGIFACRHCDQSFTFMALMILFPVMNMAIFRKIARTTRRTAIPFIHGDLIPYFWQNIGNVN